MNSRPLPEKRPVKLHPEDYDMARDFNRAAYFTAHLHNGRFEKHTVRDIASYEEALIAAENLRLLHATQGRKAMIYAVIQPGNYSILCTPEVVALAEQMRGAGA